ncbi:MAG: VPLPA-CTERM sorting domain-containing protein [Calditrichaceae bacterium]
MIKNKTKMAILLLSFAVISLPAIVNAAITVNLDTAFSNYDPFETADFGTVELTDLDDDIQFEVTLNTDVLGSGADLQWFYFNTTEGITNLSISSTTPDATLSYQFNTTSSTFRADGSGYYDGILDFGAGGSQTATATFVLSADDALEIDDFLTTSTSSSNGEYIFAVHVQSTEFLDQTSEFIGGNTVVPIPSALWFLGAGLASLVGLRKRNTSL